MWGFFTYYMPTMGSGESGLSRKKYNLSKLESITLWLEICPIFGHLQERKFVQKHKIAEVYPFFPNTKRNGQNLLTTHQSDIFYNIWSLWLLEPCFASSPTSSNLVRNASKLRTLTVGARITGRLVSSFARWLHYIQKPTYFFFGQIESN